MEKIQEASPERPSIGQLYEEVVNGTLKFDGYDYVDGWTTPRSKVVGAAFRTANGSRVVLSYSELETLEKRDSSAQKGLADSKIPAMREVQNVIADWGGPEAIALRKKRDEEIAELDNPKGRLS